ncbi:hypothetical protein CC78DRAFT_533450 [Lojkania enalia]|uniref:Uncharacterized protein n=1 Tax=Lojkania enalia TaxID=147567 RepID=A0A9P4KDR9_9PLEO|nr:hypothetical protein CC78DRAFT_533450 [Didymosphaeria enalia]
MSPRTVFLFSMTVSFNIYTFPTSMLPNLSWENQVCPFDYLTGALVGRVIAYPLDKHEQ